MSTNHILHSLKTALLIAPLLAGCGKGGGTIMITGGGLTLKDCPDGSLVGIDGMGGTDCVTPTAGALNTAPCAPNTQALNSDDGMTVKCVNKGTGTTDTSTVARIQKDQTSITDLRNKLN